MVLRWAFLMLVVGSFFSVAQAGEIRYDKGNRRDPFLPLIGPNAFRGAEGAGKDAFSLQGIVHDPKKESYAVIDGEIYREGETIDGAKIIKVLADRIILHQESNEIVLWLREEILGEKQTENSSGD